jgi:hypothetical protein
VSKQNGSGDNARLKRIEQNLANLHNQLGIVIEIVANINAKMSVLGEIAAQEMNKSGILLPEGVVPPLDLEP